MATARSFGPQMLTYRSGAVKAARVVRAPPPC